MGTKKRTDTDPLPTAIDRPCMDNHEDGNGPEGLSWVPPNRVSGDAGNRAAIDVSFRAGQPVLHDYLTITGLGGAQRVTGTLLLFAEDGKWKACINDRDGGFVAFLTSDTVAGLLEAIDKGLAKGSLDWRKSKSRR